jgi:phosphoribosylanthranilate isomerase
VLQLHGQPAPERVLRLQRRFHGEIWPVIRVSGQALSAQARELAEGAAAFLLDSAGPNGLGGSGVAFDWRAIAEQVEQVRIGRRVVVAGGLRPENVARAIEVLRPDVVDVSSGVERAPGIKDHQLMRAFRDAAHGAISHA